VHHYNGTQYCSTETVLLIFPFLQTNIKSQTWPRGSKQPSINNCQHIGQHSVIKCIYNNILIIWHGLHHFRMCESKAGDPCIGNRHTAPAPKATSHAMYTYNKLMLYTSTSASEYIYKTQDNNRKKVSFSCNVKSIKWTIHLTCPSCFVHKQSCHQPKVVSLMSYFDLLQSMEVKDTANPPMSIMYVCHFRQDIHMNN